MIQLRDDHTLARFFRRTIAAQLHAIGALAAFVGWAYLSWVTFQLPDRSQFWICMVYGIPGVMVFAASSIYHFLSDGLLISERFEMWLERFDHFAIYLFIAGSYTPVVVHAISPGSQVPLLTLIWTTAILGIFYTGFKTKLPKWAQNRFLYTGIFLLMGWAAIMRLPDLYHNLNTFGLTMLVAGGLAYSIGAVIYATKRPKLFYGIFGFHELWHVMVMLGFAFHYFLILSFYQA